MTLYTGYLTDLYKQFQVLPADNTNVENQMYNFCYNLFWKYADKPIPKLAAKNEILGPQNV